MCENSDGTRSQIDGSDVIRNKPVIVDTDKMHMLVRTKSLKGPRSECKKKREYFASGSGPSADSSQNGLIGNDLDKLYEPEGHDLRRRIARRYTNNTEVQNEEKRTVPSLICHHLGPLVCLAIYCAICALGIWKLEAEFQHEVFEIREEKIEKLVTRILDVTNDRNNTKNYTAALLRQYLHDYEDYLINSRRNRKWTYHSALFFTATVVSTIGYGSLTPATVGGRIFCMTFAFFGIPLMLLSVTRCGQGLAKLVQFIQTKFRNRFKIQTTCSKASKGEHKRLKIFLAILSLFTYIFLGALVFTLWEDWDLLTSFYFCFITMTTIGFGDVVPKHQMFMLMCAFYIIIGLAITSMCIEIAESEYVHRARKFKRTFRKMEKHVGKVGSVILFRDSSRSDSNIISPQKSEDSPDVAVQHASKL